VKLDGKIAVVTGASRGLGRDVADGLEAGGARVARVARTAEYRCDVTDTRAVGQLRERIEADLGTPQILVNAAGVFGPIEPILRSEPSRWVETLLVDAVGPYLTCREFAGGMVENGWGRIVNLTSAASLHPPGILGSAYANVIHPGDVKTEMWEDIRDQALRLGPEGDALRQWVDWVEETGGDPSQKAVELVLRILESDVNGRFLWIEDPLQPPIPSWGDDSGLQPWRR
jgi:NAD(P)-dependent dehydrogenase (short-subunit alcohol dehydrogenase family)